MTRGKLHLLVLLACLGGYLWLLASTGNKGNGVWEGCLLKEFFHIPCPSCGSTRSVRACFEGEFIQAVRFNPLGIPVFTIMTVCPLWIAADRLTQKNSLLQTYHKVESLLKKPSVTTIGILLILANWIWNIQKYTI